MPGVLAVFGFHCDLAEALQLQGLDLPRAVVPELDDVSWVERKRRAVDGAGDQRRLASQVICQRRTVDLLLRGLIESHRWFRRGLLFVEETVCTTQATRGLLV